MALAAALACVALLVITWYAAFHIGLFEHADRAILRGFAGLGQRPRVSSTALFIAHLCDPKPYVYFCAVPVVVALLRRRFVLATAICAILLGANVTTQLLKPLLAVHRPALVEGLPLPTRREAHGHPVMRRRPWRWHCAACSPRQDVSVRSWRRSARRSPWPSATRS